MKVTKTRTSYKSSKRETGLEYRPSSACTAHCSQQSVSVQLDINVKTQPGRRQANFILYIEPTWCRMFLICLLLFSTCFGQLCANHQEKIPYLCDTWYLSLYVDDCLVCIPVSHLYSVTNSRCRIGTVFSPDDGHTVARNM